MTEHVLQRKNWESNKFDAQSINEKEILTRNNNNKTTRINDILMKTNEASVKINDDSMKSINSLQTFIYS